MINFDSLTLNLFLKENYKYFEGAKIQKIQQPSKYELIFHFRINGETKKFYINFHPDFFHICFINPETENLRNIKIPKIAPMFCMLLRKYIQNSKIIRVEVPVYERIFEFYFEYFNEINEKIQLCLAVELMGKYSNVILYNYDTNIIIGCAHNVSSEKSRERELYGLIPYSYPKKQHKKNLLKTEFETFKNIVDVDNLAQSISSKFYYLTTSFVQDVIGLINPFSIEKLFEKLIKILEEKEITPSIKNDYSKYYITHFNDTFKCNDINEMIDKYFSYRQNQFIIEHLKSKIYHIINNQLNKLTILKKKQETQLKKLDEANDYKNKADILTANLYILKKGLKSIKLYDFEGKEIEIDLNENKTPGENVNDYYNLYKKSKTAYEYSLKVIEETKSSILYFQEMLFFCENTSNLVSHSDDMSSTPSECSLFEVPTHKFCSRSLSRALLGQIIIDDLNSLIEELTQESSAKLDNTNIENIEIDGFKIYIGKNKKQNDYILSKISNAEDLWFHPLNAPGAHIIVKTNKQMVTDKVILKAAEITKKYSMQKNNSKTSIIYTKRKYVKKANRKQAFVTYKNETEIVV